MPSSALGCTRSLAKQGYNNREHTSPFLPKKMLWQYLAQINAMGCGHPRAYLHAHAQTLLNAFATEAVQTLAITIYNNKLPTRGIAMRFQNACVMCMHVLAKKRKPPSQSLCRAGVPGR